jgi:ubiquinone/menaquinone biosynthesis C-methylase UbiE
VDSAEFDRFADEYDHLLRQTIAVTGEGPEFFHEYKIKALSRFAHQHNLQSKNILDFGSGIGNSTPYFRCYFASAKLAGADISQRSLDVAEERFPGVSAGLQIQENRIPVSDGTFDITFSACAFHHIPHEEHIHWLSELRRVTRKGGMLSIFEHNPLNPLTLRAVNTCPFDANAHLIRSKQLRDRFRESGWSSPKTHYHLFFPHALSGLRIMEPYLSGIPFGGQYSVTAINAA